MKRLIVVLVAHESLLCEHGLGRAERVGHGVIPDKSGVLWFIVAAKFCEWGKDM